MRSCIATFLLVCIAAGQTLIADDRIGNEYRVMGHQKCIDCHERPYEAWRRTGHASRSLEMLSTNSRSQRYAERLHIKPAELTRDSVCTDCHGTKQRTVTGKLLVNHGVSCESCHGPAGAGDTSLGWYDLHTEDSNVKEFDAGRKSALQEAGMAGVVDIYALAVRCYECHSISNEQVVNAGHIAGSPDFELTSWFSGEVRHNFAPYTIDTEGSDVNRIASNIWLANSEKRDPQARQRLLYVVGQLADLNVNLRNRAKATTVGSFATSSVGQIFAAYSRLKQVAQLLPSEELAEVIAAIESIQSLIVLPPQESHKRAITEVSYRVEKAARDFVAKFDGQQLLEIDALLPQESKGRVYQP